MKTETLVKTFGIVVLLCLAILFGLAFFHAIPIWLLIFPTVALIVVWWNLE